MTCEFLGVTSEAMTTEPQSETDPVAHISDVEEIEEIIYVGDTPPTSPPQGTIWYDTTTGVANIGPGTYQVTSGGLNGGYTTSNTIWSGASSYPNAVQCPACQAQVDVGDMLAHEEWHTEQERRMNLLEALLRDVLVNKIDIDKLLDL